MTAPMVPFLPPSARPSSLTFIDGVIYTSTSHGCGAAPNGVWALDLTADNKVTTWRTGGAHVAGSAGPTFGTDGTLYVATTKDASDGPEPPRQQRRRARPRDASAEGLVRDRWRRLQRVAGRVQAQGPRAGRRVGQRRPPVPARRRVAWRGRPPDAAPRHGEVLGAGHRRRPGDVGGRRARAGSSPRSRAGPRRASKFASNGLAPAGQPRRLQAGRRRRPARRSRRPGARRAWSRRWRRWWSTGWCLPCRAASIARAPRRSTAAQRRQRSAPARLYVLDAASGKPLWNSGLTITSSARARMAAGSGQVYLVTADNHLYAFGIPMEH